MPSSSRSSLGEERHRRRAPPHRQAISRPLSRSSWNGVCKTPRIASYDYRIPHRHAPSTTFPCRRRSRFRVSRAPRSTPPCPPLDATMPPLGQQDPGEGGMDATTVTNLPKTPQLPVPVRVKQRIVKGEFIDFDGLLHDSLLPLRHSVSPSPSVSLRVMHKPSMAGGDTDRATETS